MKLPRLPIWTMMATATGLAALAWLFTTFIDQGVLRGSYAVWQENQTFAAALVALLAAGIAARPVYMQVRAQSVQASLDLLHRIEADTGACTSARQRLFDLRRAAVNLAGEIHAYAVAQEPHVQDLKDAVAEFRAISPKDLLALSERATINSADRMKLVALSAVLKIAQQVVQDILAEEWGGVIAQAAVAKENDFVSIKLAGLFNLSSEIAEDLEVQEAAMRERAMQLRETADTGMM